MRMVDTKEVIHGIHFSGRDFRDVNDAGEYLATHFFNDDEDFTDEQVAEALGFVRAEREVNIAEFKANQAPSGW